MSQNKYKRGTQAKGFLGLLFILLQIGSLQQPIEGGAQVLMLLLQPSEPTGRCGSLEMRLGLLRKPQIVQPMRMVGRLRLLRVG